MKLPFSTVILSALIILTLLLISLQFITFDWLSQKVSNATNDGNPESWNIEVFNQIKTNGLIAILILVSTIGFLFLKLKTFKTWVDDLGVFSLDVFNHCLNIFKKNEVTTNIIIFAIIITGGFIRLFLYNDPITYDEAFSVNQYSTSSFANILSNYNYPNNHVFYNLINKILGAFIGTQEWAIRLPAFIAGMLCLPSLYVLGQQIYSDHKKSILLVSLFAFSPILIEYSVLGRGYSFIWLLNIWSFSALLSYLKSRNSKYLTLFVIFNSLAIWSVPVAIIPFGAFILFLSYRKRFSISFKLSIATFISTAILYLPILLIYGIGIASKVNMDVPESYSRLFNYHIEHSLYDFYYNFIMIKPVYFGFVSILYILAILQRSATKSWIFIILFSFIAVILLQKSIPPTRVWSVLFVFIYIPIAEQLGVIISKYKSNALYFLPLIMLLIQLFINQKKSFMMTDFRYDSAKRIVSSISESSSIVCQFPMEAPLQYYWNEFLRDNQKFNVKSSNTFIAISLEHNQTKSLIFQQWDIDSTLVKLVEKEESFELYQYKVQTK